MLLQRTELEYERMPSETSSVERVRTIHTDREWMLKLICMWKFTLIRNMQLNSASIDVKKSLLQQRVLPIRPRTVYLFRPPAGVELLWENGTGPSK